MEWYRVGYDHHALMNDMDLFLYRILGCEKPDRMTYRDVFLKYLDLNLVTLTPLECIACALHYDIHPVGLSLEDLNPWLDLLMSHLIEPKIGKMRPLYIYDYPQSQAALAKVRQEEPYPVAERFEVYSQGIELANGFHELTDPKEQRARFLDDLKMRAAQGLPCYPLDEAFLESLQNLPPSAGVALGIDRLVMLALKKQHISEVLSFS